MAIRKTRLIRSATLKGYSQAATAVGLDPVAMLRKVGLDSHQVDRPDTLISLDAFLELLALSAAESKCADFGVHAAIARGIPDLGPVSLLMREAENVEAAIAVYTSHLTLHADGTVIQLDKRSENPLIITEVLGNSREQSVQATQFSVTGIIMQIRWLIGGHFQPKLVYFSHPRPQRARIAPKFFACPVRYNQVLSGIVVPRQILSHPLVTSPPFLRKLALQHLEPILRRRTDSFATQVHRLISETLADGECFSETVAQHFEIDRRTLNRRLEREGESFSSVLQQARVEATRRALNGSDCSLTELAGLAGFQSLSSFSRWFHETFGCTATEWRRRVSAAPEPAHAPDNYPAL